MTLWKKQNKTIQKQKQKQNKTKNQNFPKISSQNQYIFGEETVVLYHCSKTKSKTKNTEILPKGVKKMIYGWTFQVGSVGWDLFSSLYFSGGKRQKWS